eukprot:921192-Alexandrium_andersonii.AAC.1
MHDAPPPCMSLTCVKQVENRACAVAWSRFHARSVASVGALDTSKCEGGCAASSRLQGLPLLVYITAPVQD